MRGPLPQTLSHETLIVPCPSPASNQNPSRRWSDWPHAGGAASHSAPDAAKTPTVLCTEPLRSMCPCKLRTDVRRHNGVLAAPRGGNAIGIGARCYIDVPDQDLGRRRLGLTRSLVRNDQSSRLRLNPGSDRDVGKTQAAEDRSCRCIHSEHVATGDRKSTRLNSSHQIISYAVFCLKKKKHKKTTTQQTNKNNR